MSMVRTLTDVPAADVGKKVKNFKDDGAAQVTTIDQGNDLWTIVAVYP